MANGFFLGGAAEGMAAADKRAIERERLAVDQALKERGLDLQSRGLDITEANNKAELGIRNRAQTLAERNAARAASNDATALVDKHINDTMSIVSEAVKAAAAAGKDPDTIRKTVAPLVASAKSLGSKVGRDPAIYDAQVNSLLLNPTSEDVAAAKAAGEAKGKALGAARAAKELQDQGIIPPSGQFKSLDEKVKAENALRDDFVKSSQPFATLSSAKTRLDSLEKTGAGDVALVFQYMKILDPGSTVREGEFATASNAAGVPSAIMSLYNKAVGGGVLGPKARQEITSQANKIFEAAAKAHDKSVTQYANIAKRSGMDPDNVIIDLSPVSSGAGVTPSGLKFKVVK